MRHVLLALSLLSGVIYASDEDRYPRLVAFNQNRYREQIERLEQAFRRIQGQLSEEPSNPALDQARRTLLLAIVDGKRRLRELERGEPNEEATDAGVSD